MKKKKILSPLRSAIALQAQESLIAPTDLFFETVEKFLIPHITHQLLEKTRTQLVHQKQKSDATPSPEEDSNTPVTQNSQAAKSARP